MIHPQPLTETAIDSPASHPSALQEPSTTVSRKDAFKAHCIAMCIFSVCNALRESATVLYRAHANADC